MPERKKIEDYYARARQRIHDQGGTINGESLEVRVVAAMEILNFLENKALEWSVSLPPDFHSYRIVLETIQGIIRKRKGYRQPKA
ncbi:MAG: hypothetical protein A3J06_02800 [Candidatus Moranbacteria bacterium RIFCSPLOWO2_02_FULL_48_19]|nr:MAG: hypothetical protein A3J06_02800 [Candidatus Moranbacteria bacterium RIFCSPLOWO2_02_FULL_48_19]OGI31390.1 MAG: hypothetical protein A3G09_05125 [Candidatus Moranbacteria bacterium RIFCSPLOWO2_12_FULL_48_12]